MSELYLLKNLYNALSNYQYTKNNVSGIAERRANSTATGRDYLDKKSQYDSAEGKINKAGDILLMVLVSLGMLLAIGGAILLALKMFSEVGGYDSNLENGKTALITGAIFFASIIMAIVSFILIAGVLGDKGGDGFAAVAGIVSVCWVLLGIICWIAFIVNAFKSSFGYGIMGILLPIVIIIVLIVHIFSPQPDIKFISSYFWKFLLICIALTAITVFLIWIINRISRNRKMAKAEYKKAEEEYASVSLPYNSLKAKYEKEVNQELTPLWAEVKKWQNKLGLLDSDLNLNKIQSWIWCIETKRANSIVEANRWLDEEQHRKQMRERAKEHYEQMEHEAYLRRQAAEQARDNASTAVDELRDINRKVRDIWWNS